MLPYRKCVAIILRKNDRIFVAERLDTKNAWQLPQGGVDKGESYVDAAKRELFEETGISSVSLLAQTDQLYRYDFPQYSQNQMLKKYGMIKYQGQELCFVEFNFLGDDSEINLMIDTQEFKQWKWETARNILNSIVEFKRECYEKAFSELNLFC